MSLNNRVTNVSRDTENELSTRENQGRFLKKNSQVLYLGNFFHTIVHSKRNQNSHSAQCQDSAPALTSWGLGHCFNILWVVWRCIFVHECTKISHFGQPDINFYKVGMVGLAKNTQQPKWATTLPSSGFVIYPRENICHDPKYWCSVSQQVHARLAPADFGMPWWVPSKNRAMGMALALGGRQSMKIPQQSMYSWWQW